MSSDFYKTSILPFAGIIIKLCRAYTNSQEDFEDYYQEVCLQIWRSKENFREESEWSTWVYRISLNVCLTLLKKKKNNGQHFVSEFTHCCIKKVNTVIKNILILVIICLFLYDLFRINLFISLKQSIFMRPITIFKLDYTHYNGFITLALNFMEPSFMINFTIVFDEQYF